MDDLFLRAMSDISEQEKLILEDFRFRISIKRIENAGIFREDTRVIKDDDSDTIILKKRIFLLEGEEILDEKELFSVIYHSAVSELM